MSTHPRHSNDILSLLRQLPFPHEIQNRIYDEYERMSSPQSTWPAPAGPRDDPTIHHGVGCRLLDGDMADVRVMIWKYFVPPTTPVPSRFKRHPRPTSSWRRHSDLLNLLCVCPEIMDEVSTSLYENRQFELRIDDTTITFLNEESAHLLPRDDVHGRPTDRFTSEQLFGFSRIRHLKVVVDTMFPQPPDACKRNPNRYDLAMYSTVQGLVTLLCADGLHRDQRGLQTLEIEFASTYLKKDKDQNDEDEGFDDSEEADRAVLYGERRAPVILPSEPRHPHFEHASEYGFALDFVLRPLSKLRWLDSVNIRFPTHWDKLWSRGCTMYMSAEGLQAWAINFETQVKTCDAGSKERRRVALDKHIVGTISMDMISEICDEWELWNVYHKKFGPAGGANDKVEEIEGDEYPNEDANEDEGSSADAEPMDSGIEDSDWAAIGSLL